MTTHRSDQCLSACRYLAIVLAALISGCDRDEVLAPDWPLLAELERLTPLHPAILEVVRGSYRRKPPQELRASRYVADSLEAALWAFHSASSFEEAILAAVNLGDEANTTAAIAGQLAGAFFGASAIPTEGIARRDWVINATSRLGLRAAIAKSPPPPRVVTLTVRTDSRLDLADERHRPPAGRCYWVVPERLLAGAYPEKFAQLWDAGLRTFVDLTEPEEVICEEVRHRVFKFPIRDRSTPMRQTMITILDAIDLAIAERQPVFVHCLDGGGRTSTVIGCWLLRHGLTNRKEVLAVLDRLRLVTASGGGQTDDQREMVLGWRE